MLRYVGNNDDNMIASVGSDGKVLISTRIVVTNTDVQHSGTYKCEPGSAPVASVNVHVLDGKFRFSTNNSLTSLKFTKKLGIEKMRCTTHKS